MSVQVETAPASVAEQGPAPAEAEAPTPGEEALGDPGKKALDAMKSERNTAKAEARDLKAQIEAMQARIDGREAEYQAEQERRNVEASALAKANERIVRSEIKAAAKGVLNDPADAFRFLDATTFTVDDDGNVDEAAISAALTDLIASKPYLGAGAAQSPRFAGGADQGARQAPPAPTLDEQIAAAQKVGDIRSVISLNNQKLAALAAARKD